MPFPYFYTICLSLSVLMIGAGANLASFPVAAPGLFLLVFTATMYRKFDPRRAERVARAVARAEREFATIFSVFHATCYPKARVPTGNLVLMVLPGLMGRLDGTYTYVLDRDRNHVSGLIADPHLPSATETSIQRVLTDLYLGLVREQLGEKGLKTFLETADVRRYIPLEPPTNHARLRFKAQVDRLLAAARIEYPWLQA